MKRLLPALAGIMLLAGVACSDDRDSSPADTTSAAPAAAQQQAGSQGTTMGQPAPALARAADDPSEVVKAVRPSVVRIRAGGQQTGAFGSVQRNEGTGTGFIIDNRGYVVTNNHVVTLGTNREAARFDVDLSDGRSVQATLVGRDERTDLAVLKIDGGNLSAIRFAAPNSIEVGDEVLAIGFALDLGSSPTVTKGVVSAKDRVIEETLSVGTSQQAVEIGGAIQTDAAINPGNSGGPLVNMRGEVVGVNTAGLVGSQRGPVQGIFFAVSSGVAEPVTRALVENGRVERGFLGVSLQTIDRQVAQAQNLKVDDGAGLARVESGGPAERAGLRAGDVITKIGDAEINSAGDVTNALFRYGPGQRVRVEYVRGGDTNSAEVTLGTRPAS